MVTIELSEKEAAVILYELKGGENEDDPFTPMGPLMSSLNTGYAKISAALIDSVVER